MRCLVLIGVLVVIGASSDQSAWAQPPREPSDSYHVDVVETVTLRVPAQIHDLVSCTTDGGYLLMAPRSTLSNVADEFLDLAATLPADYAPPLIKGFRTREDLTWLATRFEAQELRILLPELGTTRPLAIGKCDADSSQPLLNYIRDLLLYMVQNDKGHVFSPATGRFVTRVEFCLWRIRHAHGGRLLREPNGWPWILELYDWIA